MWLLIMKFFSKQEITQKCVLLGIYLDENIKITYFSKTQANYCIIQFNSFRKYRHRSYLFLLATFLRSLSVKKGKIFDHISWKLEMQIWNWLKNEGIGKLRVPSSKCPAAPDKIWVIREPALRDWGLTAKNIEI